MRLASSLRIVSSNTFTFAAPILAPLTLAPYPPDLVAIDDVFECLPRLLSFRYEF